MEAWAALTDNIFVWDYCGSFKELQMPTPGFGVMQSNIQYFVRNGVKIFFEQCSGPMGSEFHQLRGYLAAKLLWDPELDFDATMNDFLNGYYGAAGPIIREYIDLLRQNREASGEPFGIFNYTTDFAGSWLAPDKLRGYLAILDRAEAAVAGDTTLLRRVHYTRQPVQFAQLELSRTDPYGPEGYLEEVGGRWQVKREWLDKLHDFVTSCKLNGVKNVCEWHNEPDSYLRQMLRSAQVEQVDNLAFGKPVRASVPVAENRNPQGQGTQLLTDGVRGTEIYRSQWLGYYQPEVVSISTWTPSNRSTTSTHRSCKSSGNRHSCPKASRYTLPRTANGTKPQDGKPTPSCANRFSASSSSTAISHRVRCVTYVSGSKRWSCAPPGTTMRATTPCFSSTRSSCAKPITDLHGKHSCKLRES